jgi:hypothetical protein
MAKRTSLADETFEMLMFSERQQTSRNEFFCKFFKSLINALIRFFGVNCRY